MENFPGDSSRISMSVIIPRREFSVIFPGTEEEDGEGPPYADMIRTALLKLPGRQGSLLSVCNYIEVRCFDFSMRLYMKNNCATERARIIIYVHLHSHPEHFSGFRI